jgi:hypothetical protein
MRRATSRRISAVRGGERLHRIPHRIHTQWTVEHMRVGTCLCAASSERRACVPVGTACVASSERPSEGRVWLSALVCGRADSRAEQVCHLALSGQSNILLMLSHGDGAGAGAELQCQEVSMRDEWMETNLFVFEGEMTCCRLKHEGITKCDKQRPVEPMLGLYTSARSTQCSVSALSTAFRALFSASH